MNFYVFLFFDRVYVEIAQLFFLQRSVDDDPQNRDI